MRYDVRLERTVACPTAVIRANTTWREFTTLWRPLLDEVWAFVRANPGVYANGHNVMLYQVAGPKSKSPSRLVSR
ncbi:MAG TPA: hypothetical protein VNG04_12625 [Candidatus Acidoferrum sp.]|nr:hypothetical protein [Candidatus Acidoferrum sp.]